MTCPRGTFSAKVDVKGRLRLPIAVRPWLQATGARPGLFVTTFDFRTVSVFPLPVWEDIEPTLAKDERAESLWNVTHFFGQTTEIDDSGRLLIHKRLRDDLLRDCDEVVILCQPRGVIKIIPEEMFSKSMAEARIEIESVLTALSQGIQ